MDPVLAPLATVEAGAAPGLEENSGFNPLQHIKGMMYPCYPQYRFLEESSDVHELNSLTEL